MALGISSTASAPRDERDGRLSREPKPFKDGPLPPVPADLIAHVNQPAVRADDAAGILNHAAQIVSGDRAAQHGPKERNHQNIADHWNAYLGARLDRPLTALDVALMMVELKIARTKAGAGIANRDNYVDMAGYAGCAGEIALNSTEKN